MTSMSSGDSDYAESTKPQDYRPRKRLKRIKDEPVAINVVEFPLQPLLSVLRTAYADEEDTFEQILAPLLEEFRQARSTQEAMLTEMNEEGHRIRPLRHSEITPLINKLALKETLSTSEAILSRKLKSERERNRASIAATKSDSRDAPLTSLPPVPPDLPINPEVLDALYNIKTTPFSNSFLSRLHGTKQHVPPGLLAVDWETRTPWMNLMTDIHDHYTFAHPERECPMEESAPITYSTLDSSQLPQIHELLERSFWPGIDVSDSLDYQPEKSTVIAMYKKVVVGVAIISSPIQTYITYLAVKAGWDKAQIARNMLYHLITMNPTRDFTLHVSTNSSAMLLYNQFGFKAEEFVAGFYSEYLDADSRASKNAFMLRLRHI